MDESARVLRKIFNNFVDLSKIEVSHLIIEDQIFSLGSAIEFTVTLLRPLGREKGLPLVVHVDSSIAERLRGDATRIGQIVVNLVNSAIKCMSLGGVMVSAKPKSCYGSQVMVSILVMDTGIGVAAAETKHCSCQPSSWTPVCTDSSSSVCTTMLPASW